MRDIIFASFFLSVKPQGTNPTLLGYFLKIFFKGVVVVLRKERVLLKVQIIQIDIHLTLIAHGVLVLVSRVRYCWLLKHFGLKQRKGVRLIMSRYQFRRCLMRQRDTVGDNRGGSVMMDQSRHKEVFRLFFIPTVGRNFLVLELDIRLAQVWLTNQLSG